MADDTKKLFTVGDFTRKLSLAYTKWISPVVNSGEEADDGKGTTEAYVKGFSDIGLEVTSIGVSQLLECISSIEQEDNETGESEGRRTVPRKRGVSWGDFCVIAAELFAQKEESESQAAKEDRSSLSPRSASVGGMFLGGSCNPTVWRKEIAIPNLEKAGVTFFNPQVEKWYPELIKIEEQAKQDASMLFFVIDSRTRGVTSMVEAAYLIGQDRRIVVVLNDITRDIAIEGVALSQRELRDLNRGRSYLRDLAQTHCTVVEPSVEEGIRTVTDVLKKQISIESLTKKCIHTQSCSQRIEDRLKLVHHVFSMYHANRTHLLSQQELCLALRSVRSLPDPLPSSLASVFLSPSSSSDKTTLLPANSTKESDLQTFCVCYAELRHQSQCKNRKGWLYSFSSLAWAPVQWLEEWVLSDPHCLSPSISISSNQHDIFLGGTCGTSKWRSETVIPILKRYGISYFNPQVFNWDPIATPIENKDVKDDSKIILFVITGKTLSIGSLIEAGYCIGRDKEVVLCIQDIPVNESDTTTIEGMELTEASVKDYNRGRSYLANIAENNKVPLYGSVSEAAMWCVHRLKDEPSHQHTRKGKKRPASDSIG